MLLTSLTKGLATLALMVASTSALAWTVKIQDDLFSESGKSAILDSNGRNISLWFECGANKLEFAYMENDPQTRDEPSGFSIPMTLIVKVDDEQPFRFSSAWTRRNQYYVHAEVSGSQYPNEVISLLEQIKAAKSKVVVGTSTGDYNNTRVLGVSGSTAATTKFMETCGIKE